MDLIAARAQFSTEGFDSIPILKPVELFLHFDFTNSAIKNAKLFPGSIFRYEEPEKKRKALRTFELPGKLYLNDTCDMDILLYGKWQKIKSFELGKSGDDGDNSDFRITNDIYLTWDKGVSSVMIKDLDTIGHFSISTNLLNDTAYQRWLTPLYVEQGLNRLAPEQENIARQHRSFGFKGSYKDWTIQMVYWGEGKKGWIFRDTTLVGFWRSDNDNIDKKQRTKIARRWSPYLLVKPGLTMDEQVDMIRIAFFIRFIAEVVK